MRLGILGGTFDPVHYAHLLMAEDARTRFGLDRVLVVPNASPPHKTRCIAPADDRYAMVQLAVSGNDALVPSRVEMDRPGLSYTVDTLAAVAALYPGAGLYFIAGSDALAEMATWRAPEEVARRCTLVCVEREGWTMADVAGLLPPGVSDAVRVLPNLPIAISSTEVRRRVAAGENIRYLTPDAVVQYIVARGLYQARGEEPPRPHGDE